MRKFLNIGSGPICYPSTESVRWLNVDKVNPAADVLQNFAEPGPMRENEWDGAIAIHVLEHCDWPTGVEGFLKNALHVLKPGGTLRLVVPDLMKVAKLYVEGDDLKGVYGPDFVVTGPDCAATRFLHFARDWEHTVLFDAELLRIMMQQAGFNYVREVDFGESDVPELANLDRFASESVVFEGDKP